MGVLPVKQKVLVDTHFELYKRYAAGCNKERYN